MPSVKRFVVCVMHPQAMVYLPRGPKAVIQDRHLTAAARFGGITINETFYEKTHKKNTYGRLCGFQREVQKSLEKKAKVEVATAIENWHGNLSGVVSMSIASSEVINEKSDEPSEELSAETSADRARSPTSEVRTIPGFHALCSATQD